MNRKKNVLLTICIIITLCIASLFTLCSDTAKAATKLSKTKLTLEVGQSKTLKLSGAKGKVIWSSSKKSVATVTSNGKVTAKEVGTATITAKSNGKKYTCKVTVKQYYGSVEGNVTYLYNKYKGNVSDTNALVILIPKNQNATEMPVLDSYVMWDMKSQINDNGNKYGVYCGTVDGNGEYAIQHIPTGDYIIYIKSKKTTSKFAFDDRDNYIESICNRLDGYLDPENAEMLGEAAGYSNVLIDEITIYEGETTKYSFDFGITYI